VSSAAQFIFGMRSGDMAADAIMSPHWAALNSISDKHFRRAYSETFECFYFTINAEGAYEPSRREGFDRLRVMPKLKYATVDLYYSRCILELDRAMIAAQTGEMLAQSSAAMSLRISKKDASFRKQDFDLDVRIFRKTYLAEFGLHEQ
jgi:hypothetical protein